jgi:TonB-dependent receptor
MTVTFVGFAPATVEVSVGSGQSARAHATLNVASNLDSVLVTAERPHGEAEAINRIRSAENILQVLPHDVITSLPNANVADAIGRLPSVTLERDEGEGKYVQIRGTEPRYSSVTIDGVNVPSPETARVIKLDIIPSDLVESVEINKTLLANMDGDAIGGSVILRTKTAGEQPTMSFFGIGGGTPIIGGRAVTQFGGTVGKRFGKQKRFGALFGATYDWNGRGIDDIEPALNVVNGTATYSGTDLREYRYYRGRWGLGGSFDFKPTANSQIYLRGCIHTSTTSAIAGSFPRPGRRVGGSLKARPIPTPRFTVGVSVPPCVAWITAEKHAESIAISPQKAFRGLSPRVSSVPNGFRVCRKLFR